MTGKGRLRAACFSTVAAAVLLPAVLSRSPAAQGAPGAVANQAAEGATLADYRSQHFLVHTDLPAVEAQELLERLETMLSLISTYWGRPLRGVIECYVVGDPANWPPGSISQEAVPHIAAGAGVTVTQKLTRGNQFVARAVVHAVADRGTPQHESVHAYCAQTFGTTGPVWYSEGMAEMGNYWRKDDSSVQVPQSIIDYLRDTPPKSLNDIVNGVEFTGDSWQNYAWRWALCHLLANNANYRAKFRPMGLALLTEPEELPAARRTTFEKVYGDMADEISFEYVFFLQHMQQGYRVDLCSWDWKRKFRAIKGSMTVASRINAPNGWQPSGVLVSMDQAYQFTTTGKWRIAPGGEEVTADGTSDGKGGLEGIVLVERETSAKAAGDHTAIKYHLSEPFELGAEGSFTAPVDGKLYLRCRDEWNGLDDNRGQVTVKIKRS